MKSNRWFLSIIVIIALTVIGWEGFKVLGRTLHENRLRKTKTIMLEVGTRINTLRGAWGELPTDKIELATKFKIAVPNSAWNKPIDYKRLGATNFQLKTLSPYPYWEILEYNSSVPERGVAVFLF